MCNRYALQQRARNSLVSYQKCTAAKKGDNEHSESEFHSYNEIEFHEENKGGL